MAVLNIIDHRKRKYRFLKVNAVIEPTRHDDSCKDADKVEPLIKHEWMGYAEQEHVTVRDAIAWADRHIDDVTLYLYDEDDGIYETSARPTGESARTQAEELK